MARIGHIKITFKEKAREAKRSRPDFVNMIINLPKYKERGFLDQVATRLLRWTLVGTIHQFVTQLLRAVHIRTNLETPSPQHLHTRTLQDPAHNSATVNNVRTGPHA